MASTIKNNNNNNANTARGGEEIPVWTELRVESRGADPEERIAAWWSEESEKARTRGVSSTIEQIISWDDVAPEEVTADVHFFKRTLRYIAGPMPDQPFALFWSWKRPGKIITVHGGIFPRSVWEHLKLASSSNPLYSSVHKSVVAPTRSLRVAPFRKSIPKPQPHKAVETSEEFGNGNTASAVESAQSGLPLPNLDWLGKLRECSDLFDKTFYLSADVSHDPNADCKPYDGSERMIFRPDELSYYLDYTNKLFYCVYVIAGLEDGSIARGSSQMSNMEAYLLEPDLSDPRERELDYKTRLLFATFAARLMLKARSKNKSERSVPASSVKHIPERDMRACALGLTRSATESVSRCMLQVLAYQYEIRHRYLFSRERDAIRVARMNGSYFWLTQNCVYGRRDAIDSLLRMDKMEVQRNAQIRKRLFKPGEIVHCSSVRVNEILTKRVSLYSNSVNPTELCAAEAPYSFSAYSDVKIASDHWIADFKQDVNCSVRFDTESNLYVVVSEPLEISQKRLGQDRDSLELSDMFPASSSLHSSTLSRSRGLQQVLLSGVPVIFYMLWEINCCQQYGDLLAFVINRLVHEEAFHTLFDRQSILYYGHRSGDLKNSNLYIQSCNGFNYIMVMLPTLVFAEESGLLSFVKAVKHGLSMSHLSAWSLKRTNPLSREISSKIAEKVYAPVDECVTDKELFDGQDCYTPGYRFVYLSHVTFEFEVHPSLAEFHHTIYPSSLKHHPILGSMADVSTRPSPPPSAVKSEQPCDPLADENAKLDVDAWPLPFNEQTKSACDQHETYRFLHNYSLHDRERVPEQFLIVPIYELHHGALVSGAESYSKRSCFFKSDALGMRCSTCGHCNILCSDRDPNELYQMISYRQVPMWQFGMLLMPVRLMCGELDRRTKDETVASDLDEFMTREMGLGGMWTELTKLLETNLQSLNEVKIEMQIDYEMVRKDIDTCRALIAQSSGEMEQQQQQLSVKTFSAAAITEDLGGLAPRRTKFHADEVKAPSVFDQRRKPAGIYTNDIKERIKRYIAIKPQDFYAPFKGEKFQTTDKDIRWGTRGSFSVLTKKRVVKNKKTNTDMVVLPGNYVDFETEDYGDVFKFVMKERYKSDDPSECFTASVMFCHAWVLRKYGLDALACDPADRTDIVAKDAIDGDASVTQSNLERKLREARTLWKSSLPFSKEARDGSTAGIKYMEITRSIRSDRVLLGGAFRFNPSFPLMEGGRSLAFAAVVVPLVNPMDPDREIRGVHAIFVDEVAGTKVSYLDQQKKTRGEWMPNAVPIQGKNLTDEDRKSAAKEFHCTTAICEGPETGASIADACPELEVWSMLGITNIGNFQSATPGASLLYCADNDGITPKHDEKIKAQVKKLTDKGYTVYVAKPDLIDPKKERKADFNDILTKVFPRAEAVARIRDTLKKAQVFTPTGTRKEGEAVAKVKDEPREEMQPTDRVAIKRTVGPVKFEPPEAEEVNDAERQEIQKLKTLAEVPEGCRADSEEQLFATESTEKSSKRSRLEELVKKKKCSASGEMKRPPEGSDDGDDKKKKKKKKTKHSKKREGSPLLVEDEVQHHSAPVGPLKEKKKKGHVIEDSEDEDEILKSIL
jgi:hypothetical protein